MSTKIRQLLKVFNDATNTLSSICYPTTNLFMIETFNIVGALLWLYLSRGRFKTMHLSYES